MNNDPKAWEVLQSEYLIRKPWLTARRDCVRLPNGTENHEYYILEYPDWVNVIAITEDGKFIMERQYRHGLRRTDYEICAGVCEKGETPLESAQRELYEETGFGEGKWTRLMSISPNSSTTTNLCHCFLAQNVRRVSGQHLEDTEDIAVHLMTTEDVRTLLLNNEIKQALMLAPLWRYFAERHLI
ncbi:MAG: NUDIX hydrolase [Paraprevotella sp.]|nr:NUDIX hydrolase [Paraprevotella sp.]